MGDIRAGLDELKLDVALFADVKYYVSGEGDPKILGLLQKGGASRSNYFSDLVTHLIAGYEVLENDISVAKDLYEIPAVTQDWILYSVRCKKLLPPKYFSPEGEQLFSNVRACVSQVSRADSKALWAMITFQGGKCQMRLDRYCTHLITGKASGVKYDTAMRFDTHHVQIVTPDWVTECCKKSTLVPEVEYHPRLLIYPSPNSSTALITGFMDEDGENNPSQEEQDRTKAMLEQLKQRMPWNQPNTSASSSSAPPQSVSANATMAVQPPMTSSVANVQQQQQSQQPQQQQQQQQQQQHYSRPVPPNSLPGYLPPASPAPSNANLQNQNNWHSQSTSGVTSVTQMKPQVQQSELSQQPSQMLHHQQQQLPQQQLPQQQQMSQQHQQQMQQQQQQNFTQPQQQPQQLLNPQVSPQLTSQPQAVTSQQQSLNQQSLMSQQPQQQLNMQLPQHQLAAQQQLLSPQKQQHLGQHQILSQQQQQLNPQQQQQLVPQQQQLVQQPQLLVQQQQQMAMQQQQQQQLPPQQQQQLVQQHQLPPPQQVPQQQQQQQQQQQPLTPEQRQQLHLLQQQQQQQKIQQISQQLQQSAPQSSQQFVIRDGQLQQQSTNQQLISANQQSFLVQRDPQWQQQQYHLQLRQQHQQQQQAQQQLGQQRPVGQWAQQPPQPPRQLIQLDAQTHQQLQQMDPQQRAQFIQKIQKQRNLIIQRQMQNRQAQQQGGPHIAVIRSPGKPGQPGLQWVQQPRAPIMGPQVATVQGQKPMHPGVQTPALTSINPPNQVIVQSGQAVQGPQTPASGQAFQQVQPLTPQHMAQLHLQKQQQMARLQLQHLQQQQAQQQAQQQQAQQQQQQQSVPQQETPLVPLSANSQMPPDQQLVVNAKTKTALANMLTNRLQGGTAEGSAAGQLRLMTAQHRPPPPPSQDPQLLAAYQRRTLGNITNGAPPVAPIKMQYAPSMPQPKAQFYGHNPNLKLPPDLFLLGCIFVIVEYELNVENDVNRWKQIIERHGGEVEPQYCPRATHVLAITQKHPIVVQALREGKRCVSADWLSDVVTKQQVLPPWHALHLPIPFSLNELPCTKQIISSSGFEDEEKAKVTSMLELLGAKCTKYFSRHNTLIICRKPDGPKYKKAREWQTPVVNAQWLTDLMCGQRGVLHQTDAPKYQHFSLANPFRLDYSLVPHLMAAWKMPINITQESYDKVKQVGQGPNAMRKYKKPRLEEPLMNKEPHLLGLDEPIVISNPDPPPPETQPKILFSGINPKKHAKRIRELGGALASSWRDATHLVMATPLRTIKLLCCLSRCKYIVNLQWLLDCSAKNTFVDESSYTLGDSEFEKSFNCNIEKALASPNRGSVLKGKTFYVTPSVVPSPSAFGEIVESAGGTLEKTRRSVAQIQEMNMTKTNYIIITHDSDLHLLADVLRAEISVFNAEIVLGAISRQNFQIDANQL